MNTAKTERERKTEIRSPTGNTNMHKGSATRMCSFTTISEAV